MILTSRKWLSDEPIVLQTDMNILKDVLTLIDSEASDHYFADKLQFTLYISYNLLKTGFLADRDSTFTIFWRESVQFSTEIDGVS